MLGFLDFVRSNRPGPRGVLTAAAALLLSACPDDPPDASEGSGSSDTGHASTGEASTEGPADTTAGPASSTGVDTTAGSSSTGEPPPLELEVEAFTYPNQPMVIDLAFSAPDLTITVEHDFDEGVRAAPFTGQPDQTWMRVRGLAPDTLHDLHWTAENAAGSTAMGTIGVATEAPLPGFVPSFTVEGTGMGYGGNVLFDLLSFAPGSPGSLFVVDTNGVTRWHISRNDGLLGPPAVYAGAKLRPDGTLLFLRDFSLQVIDEMGAPQIDLSPEDLGLPGLHHDVIELDNGNFLALSFTFRDIDYMDIGLTHVAGDLIVELTPTGDVVWQWDSFDHLDPNRRPEGFDDVIFDPDAMQNGQDWTHGNGIVYDAANDTILFSMRHQDWVIAIDGTSGDVLWRFGEGGDFTLTAGTWQYHQHSPQWQEDGTLLLYDNGLANPNVPDPLETSRAVRYSIDFGTMEVAQVWEDEAEDFMAPIAGDTDRLPDGSILVTDSSIDLGIGMIHARIREIDERSSATPQWSITTEIGNFIYRCLPISLYPGETP